MRSHPGFITAVAAVLAASTLFLPATAEPGADHTLRLAEFAFDPLVQEPVLPVGWNRSASGTPDLHLVQFDGPIPGDVLARLQPAGVTPIDVSLTNPQAFSSPLRVF